MKARETGAWGKGRAERGTRIERDRGRNFLNDKSDLEKKCVGPVGVEGSVTGRRQEQGRAFKD